jgi:hypothetical protein
MTEDVKWEMRFDLNTIEHLGVKLYTQYPPMIAELLSNSWDADANDVHIYLYDRGEKRIVVTDNGTSMDANEINACFLTVGRNRRIANSSGDSAKKSRAVLGKKGIGKLSMFGIAETIIVTTVKNSFKNSFSMTYSTMKKSGGSYSPAALIKQQQTEEPDGTKIELIDIKRKSSFEPLALAQSLAKRFSIFDELNVYIVHNNAQPIQVENKTLFDGIAKQFEWAFPEDFEALLPDLDYYKNKGIFGVLRTSSTPLKKMQQGVTLLARKKLVQENAFFDDRSNDYFHSYLYGVLNVDFIDQDNDIDNVSTDRKSLVWEGEELEELREKLNDILKVIATDWRKKRALAKKTKFKAAHNIDVDTWISELSAAERPLARSISDSIINSTELEEDKSASLLLHIQDAFSLQGFQDFAETLRTLGVLDEGKAIKLLEDWQFIEAKEMAKLSDGRVSTIDQFGKYITANVSETKIMQKFLEKFPWILDPRMTTFEREVTYSAWLKEHFKEEKLEESNKRIDFLCTNNNGTVHIIELKRPKIKIGLEEINQCTQYIEFIKNRSPDSVKKVKVILISENHNYGPGVQTMVDSLRNSQDFEIKSYSDLLAQARQYHKDFIDRYEEILSLKRKRATP